MHCCMSVQCPLDQESSAYTDGAAKYKAGNGPPDLESQGARHEEGFELGCCGAGSAPATTGIARAARSLRICLPAQPSSDGVGRGCPHGDPPSREEKK